MVNMQKYVTFLYTKNEQVELEIENTIPFTLPREKKKKFYSIKLTRGV